MLSPDEKKNLSIVFNRFLESEINSWDKIDDQLSYLEWLTDNELFLESDSLFDYHKDKSMSCPYTHPKDDVCPVHNIVEAVECILRLYKDTENLHPKNRYILSYYLVLSNLGMIVELK